MWHLTLVKGWAVEPLFGGWCKRCLARKDLVRRLTECGDGCDQFVRHTSVIIPPSILRAENIEFDIICSGPGEMVLAQPRQYHAVINRTASFAIATNFVLPNEDPIPKTLSLCPDDGLCLLEHRMIRKFGHAKRKGYASQLEAPPRRKKPDRLHASCEAKTDPHRNFPAPQDQHHQNDAIFNQDNICPPHLCGMHPTGAPTLHEGIAPVAHQDDIRDCHTPWPQAVGSWMRLQFETNLSFRSEPTELQQHNSAMARLWDPERLLDIRGEPMFPDGIQCRGRNGGSGPRCGWTKGGKDIERDDVTAANELLRTMAAQPPSNVTLEMLQNLASLCLCRDHHQGQIDRFARDWEVEVRQFETTYPSVPATSPSPAPALSQARQSVRQLPAFPPLCYPTK